MRWLLLLQLINGIDGQPVLPESTVEGVSSWQDSALVRIGNWPSVQKLVDVLGRSIDLALIQPGRRSAGVAWPLP